MQSRTHLHLASELKGLGFLWHVAFNSTAPKVDSGDFLSPLPQFSKSEEVRSTDCEIVTSLHLPTQ